MGTSVHPASAFVLVFFFAHVDVDQIGRVIWDHVHGDETGKTYTMAESIAEHRREWRSALGLPP